MKALDERIPIKKYFSLGLSVNMAKNGQNRQNMANIAQNMANFGDSSASPTT